jgi:hypothetical protein
MLGAELIYIGKKLEGEFVIVMMHKLSFTCRAKGTGRTATLTDFLYACSGLSVQCFSGSSSFRKCAPLTPRSWQDSVSGSPPPSNLQLLVLTAAKVL